MTVSSPARTRLGRLLSEARDRRDHRIDKSHLRSQLSTYRTTSELSELSAIAARNPHVDTAALRTRIAGPLSR
jgi:hypothetical protein